MRKLETASFPTQNASLRPPTAGTRVSRHVRLQVNAAAAHVVPMLFRESTSAGNWYWMKRQLSSSCE